MYAHTRRTWERPHHFTLNPNHPLSVGCVFAGLGAQPGGTIYRDSSQYGNHGVLTGFTGAGNTPPERWGRVDGRPFLSFDGGSTSVITSATGPAADADWTVSVKCVPFAVAGTFYPLVSTGVASTNKLRVFGIYYGFWLWSSYGPAFYYGSPAIGSGYSVVHREGSGSVETRINGVATVSGANVAATSASAISIGATVGWPSFNGRISDCLVWSRKLTIAECYVCESPDPLYDGWIVPDVARRYFVPVSGAKPWLWTRRSAQLIGGGKI